MYVILDRPILLKARFTGLSLILQVPYTLLKQIEGTRSTELLCVAASVNSMGKCPQLPAVWYTVLSLEEPF